MRRLFTVCASSVLSWRIPGSDRLISAIEVAALLTRLRVSRLSAWRSDIWEVTVSVTSRRAVSTRSPSAATFSSSARRVSSSAVMRSLRATDPLSRCVISRCLCVARPGRSTFNDHRGRSVSKRTGKGRNSAPRGGLRPRSYRERYDSEHVDEHGVYRGIGPLFAWFKAPGNVLAVCEKG